ncbi:alpha-D-glucose phosphate-specific phosphoglucomutase [Pseudosulfitobacter sp. DSM 107133]|uniref:alpha-D-glucose phosphate-specific phosphoglucomutase n=1 Tax=Pseudosulfitobacter sp. DSM 107133 TaxID=2883100 RepID=UPI000DF1143F|nr:alpha-D-glucose phosphate-specific phosphoglucomutase [Pseudosulfitobacter sp. DSM 107133]UOA27316.1 Phosphoglucomutase [Pseudosulfitobacter sp. DSM 107133]
MTIKTISTTIFNDQKPGTSGLRKKTRTFMGPHYLENYVSATFTAIGGGAGKCFVLGGDGRFFNRPAIQTILKMAAAQGAARIIVGQGGLLSTPAASHLIRLNGADGGFILSASHNPGGIDADFGLKFNAANGGPASEALTARIHDATLAIKSYDIAEVDDINLDTVGQTRIGTMVIDVVDPVADYSDLMASLFDFDAIRALFAGGFTMRFDAMHAVTGPYAHAILEDTLGAAKGTVVNGVPSEDFGKGHPDPNPIWAKELMDLMMSEAAPDMGAASDGDGDRNMIVGKGTYITPSDSLAMLAANAHLVPAYKNGIAGIARSMPTSAAADRVAEALGIPCFETPTGWKFFGTLLDAGRVTICGEESAGTGSHHVREKDGLWAVLLWLNILAARGKSVAEIQADHWQRFGRNYYARHDYEAVESARADNMMAHLRAQLDSLPGQRFAGLNVTRADDFAYTDPVDGATSAAQGIRLFFEGGARAVFRLSGTGTEGATVRLYLEQFVKQSDYAAPVEQVLEAVRAAALEISDLPNLTGRSRPDVET